MDATGELKRIMAAQTEIALATCVEGIPNVRLVNFIYDENTKTIYFSTFKNNDKVKEIRKNPNVAFTTIPKEGNAHVKARGVAGKSSLNVIDVAEAFVSKIPDYRETLEQAGRYLVLYEIKFERAAVTLDLDNIAEVTL